ncbi:MAG: beta strand repeat-containing protein, partial [Bdellovibrionota bacterium]
MKITNFNSIGGRTTGTSSRGAGLRGLRSAGVSSSVRSTRSIGSVASSLGSTANSTSSRMSQLSSANQARIPAPNLNNNGNLGALRANQGSQNQTAANSSSTSGKKIPPSAREVSPIIKEGLDRTQEQILILKNDIVPNAAALEAQNDEFIELLRRLDQMMSTLENDTKEIKDVAEDVGASISEAINKVFIEKILGLQVDPSEEGLTQEFDVLQGLNQTRLDIASLINPSKNLEYLNSEIQNFFLRDNSEVDQFLNFLGNSNSSNIFSPFIDLADQLESSNAGLSDFALEDLKRIGLEESEGVPFNAENFMAQLSEVITPADNMEEVNSKILDLVGKFFDRFNKVQAVDVQSSIDTAAILEASNTDFKNLIATTLSNLAATRAALFEEQTGVRDEEALETERINREFLEIFDEAFSYIRDLPEGVSADNIQFDYLIDLADQLETSNERLSEFNLNVLNELGLDRIIPSDVTDDKTSLLEDITNPAQIMQDVNSAFASLFGDVYDRFNFVATEDVQELIDLAEDLERSNTDMRDLMDVTLSNLSDIRADSIAAIGQAEDPGDLGSGAGALETQDVNKKYLELIQAAFDFFRDPASEDHSFVSNADSNVRFDHLIWLGEMLEKSNSDLSARFSEVLGPVADPGSENNLPINLRWDFQNELNEILAPSAQAESVQEQYLNLFAQVYNQLNTFNSQNVQALIEVANQLEATNVDLNELFLGTVDDQGFLNDMREINSEMFAMVDNPQTPELEFARNMEDVQAEFKILFDNVFSYLRDPASEDHSTVIQVQNPATANANIRFDHLIWLGETLEESNSKLSEFFWKTLKDLGIDRLIDSDVISDDKTFNPSNDFSPLSFANQLQSSVSPSLETEKVQSDFLELFAKTYNQFNTIADKNVQNLIEVAGELESTNEELNFLLLGQEGDQGLLNDIREINSDLFPIVGSANNPNPELALNMEDVHQDFVNVFADAFVTFRDWADADVENLINLANVLETSNANLSSIFSQTLTETTGIVDDADATIEDAIEFEAVNTAFLALFSRTYSYFRNRSSTDFSRFIDMANELETSNTQLNELMIGDGEDQGWLQDLRDIRTDFLGKVAEPYALQAEEVQQNLITDFNDAIDTFRKWVLNGPEDGDEINSNFADLDTLINWASQLEDSNDGLSATANDFLSDMTTVKNLYNSTIAPALQMEKVNTDWLAWYDSSDLTNEFSDASAGFLESFRSLANNEITDIINRASALEDSNAAFTPDYWVNTATAKDITSVINSYLDEAEDLESINSQFNQLLQDIYTGFQTSQTFDGKTVQVITDLNSLITKASELEASNADSSDDYWANITTAKDIRDKILGLKNSTNGAIRIEDINRDLQPELVATFNALTTVANSNTTGVQNLIDLAQSLEASNAGFRADYIENRDFTGDTGDVEDVRKAFFDIRDEAQDIEAINSQFNTLIQNIYDGFNNSISFGGKTIQVVSDLNTLIARAQDIETSNANFASDYSANIFTAKDIRADTLAFKSDAFDVEEVNRDLQPAMVETYGDITDYANNDIPSLINLAVILQNKNADFKADYDVNIAEATDIRADFLAIRPDAVKTEDVNLGLRDLLSTTFTTFRNIANQDIQALINRAVQLQNSNAAFAADYTTNINEAKDIRADVLAIKADAITTEDVNRDLQPAIATTYTTLNSFANTDIQSLINLANTLQNKNADFKADYDVNIAEATDIRTDFLAIRPDALKTEDVNLDLRDLLSTTFTTFRNIANQDIQALITRSVELQNSNAAFAADYTTNINEAKDIRTDVLAIKADAITTEDVNRDLQPAIATTYTTLNSFANTDIQSLINLANTLQNKNADFKADYDVNIAEATDIRTDFMAIKNAALATEDINLDLRNLLTTSFTTFQNIANNDVQALINRATDLEDSNADFAADFVTNIGTATNIRTTFLALESDAIKIQNLYTNMRSLMASTNSMFDDLNTGLTNASTNATNLKAANTSLNTVFTSTLSDLTSLKNSMSTLKTTAETLETVYGGFRALLSDISTAATNVKTNLQAMQNNATAMDLHTASRKTYFGDAYALLNTVKTDINNVNFGSHQYALDALDDIYSSLNLTPGNTPTLRDPTATLVGARNAEFKITTTGSYALTINGHAIGAAIGLTNVRDAINAKTAQTGVTAVSKTSGGDSWIELSSTNTANSFAEMEIEGGAKVRQGVGIAAGTYFSLSSQDPVWANWFSANGGYAKLSGVFNELNDLYADLTTKRTNDASTISSLTTSIDNQRDAMTAYVNTTFSSIRTLVDNLVTESNNLANYATNQRTTHAVSGSATAVSSGLNTLANSLNSLISGWTTDRNTQNTANTNSNLPTLLSNEATAVSGYKTTQTGVLNNNVVSGSSTQLSGGITSLGATILNSINSLNSTASGLNNTIASISPEISDVLASLKSFILSDINDAMIARDAALLPNGTANNAISAAIDSLAASVQTNLTTNSTEGNALAVVTANPQLATQLTALKTFIRDEVIDSQADRDAALLPAALNNSTAISSAIQTFANEKNTEITALDARDTAFDNSIASVSPTISADLTTLKNWILNDITATESDRDNALLPNGTANNAISAAIDSLAASVQTNLTTNS